MFINKRQRFLFTSKSLHIYFSICTYSIAWGGLKWVWFPSINPGMGENGWMFHWLCFLAERFCFDKADWGQEKSEDMELLFGAIVEQITENKSCL